MSSFRNRPATRTYDHINLSHVGNGSANVGARSWCDAGSNAKTTRGRLPLGILTEIKEGMPGREV